MPRDQIYGLLTAEKEVFLFPKRGVRLMQFARQIFFIRAFGRYLRIPRMRNNEHGSHYLR